MAIQLCVKISLLFFAIATVANANPPQKISGGVPCRVGEYPFMVSLNHQGSHLCGGSIISQRHVLTAAHCIVDIQLRSLQIITGTIYYNTGGESHSVRNVWYHRGYNRGDSTSPNDIAVIELAAPIRFNNNQNQISIASSLTPTGASATAIGWGYASPQHPVNSYYLKKVSLKTIQSKQCQPYLPYRLWTHQICGSGMQGQGVCMGDSGGPLVYNNQLIGIVSYGIPCAVGNPDVFTSVSHYRDWISEVINK